tara:strand:- start:336 stop:731 length:396 start_codon:yes stop_codon:yes gene_type:complete
MANNNKRNNKQNKDDTQNMLLIGIMIVCIFVMWKKCKTNKTFEMMGNAGTPVLNMYGREGCGWTTKMREHVNSSSLLSEKCTIKYIDIELDPVGKQQFQQLGFQGVPAFECNGRVASGYMEDYQLLEQLEI